VGGNHPPTFYQPLPILFDELSVVSTNIVELVTIWFIPISLVLAEAMVLVAIVRIRAFIIFIVKFILSTIGGIEIRVPTRFLALNLASPIVLVFGNHFIPASASLGVVIVCWNRHNILWVDLDDHGLSTIGIRKGWKILDGAEVESRRASAILVLIDSVARHFTYLANRVVECSRVNVFVIGTNILEGEEVSILCDREFSCFQEVIEFIDCSLRWIIHEVLEEVEKWFMGQTITHEIQNTLCERVVNDLSMIVNRTILDLDIGSIEIGINLLTDIDDVDESIPILLADCFKCLFVFGVIGVDCI
jgi:hypothetical protein